MLPGSISQTPSFQFLSAFGGFQDKTPSFLSSPTKPLTALPMVPLSYLLPSPHPSMPLRQCSLNCFHILFTSYFGAPLWLGGPMPSTPLYPQHGHGGSCVSLGAPQLWVCAHAWRHSRTQCPPQKRDKDGPSHLKGLPALLHVISFDSNKPHVC